MSGIPRFPTPSEKYDPRNEAEFRREVAIFLASVRGIGGRLTKEDADALFLTPAEGNAAYAALVHTHAFTDITSNPVKQPASINIVSASFTNFGLSGFSYSVWLLRDGTNGGSCVVIGEALDGTLTIVSQISGGSSTVFAITTTPTATQIGLQNNTSGQLSAKGGSSRNNVSLRGLQIVVA